MKKIYFVVLLVLFSFTGLQAHQPAATEKDFHSFSNPNEVIVKHVELDLSVDFKRNQLSGSAILDIQVMKKKRKGKNELILDTRDLNISKVMLLAPGKRPKKLCFKIGKREKILGSPLKIKLPKLRSKKTAKIEIRYSTSPEASGLHWLEPQQTAGGIYPFLYTQSQAIHARSWIPLQDTPQVRATYTATIKTPKKLRAVMSASNELYPVLDGIYDFQMPQAIPSYLIALAVGDIKFKPIGEQTGVFSEASLLDAAAAEFEDTQDMLKFSEQLYGSYLWGRYDILILPPSFPYGGMENPRLSFITPTILAGDKSLVNIIAHELAHSWSGNLVTNANWGDLWLNEGFTCYVESRIMEEIYGQDRAAMENVLGYLDLIDEMSSLEPRDQILAADLRGRDPDDAFTWVPYVKGQLFVTFLEHVYGRDKFDEFLINYFEHFSFKSLTTEDFLRYFKKQLFDQQPHAVQWSVIKQWVYQPGMPESTPVPESDAFDQVYLEQVLWLEGEKTAAQLDTQDWVVHQWLYFLNTLPDRLSLAQLTELDTVYAFTQSNNNEIAHAWLLVAIEQTHEPAYERLENYLLSIGRIKLIRPLYQALAETDQGREFALDVYERARPVYHRLAVSLIDEILDWGK
ncbi:MAG: M1 family metallopeptidase [Desulfobacteraceae bacterium]|nr:M1 family metallopeptidase [Desulfobacteraceae bacterium]